MSPDQEQSIIKQYSRLGREIPKHILDKPKLSYDEPYLYSWFLELGTERFPSSNIVTQIPITKIYEHARNLLIPDEYLARFVYCIRQLDLHYVRVSNDELSSMRKAKK